VWLPFFAAWWQPTHFYGAIAALYQTRFLTKLLLLRYSYCRVDRCSTTQPTHSTRTEHGGFLMFLFVYLATLAGWSACTCQISQWFGAPNAHEPEIWSQQPLLASLLDLLMNGSTKSKSIASVNDWIVNAQLRARNPTLNNTTRTVQDKQKLCAAGNEPLSLNELSKAGYTWYIQDCFTNRGQVHCLLHGTSKRAQMSSLRNRSDGRTDNGRS
jgi:hypothetical protein